MSVSKEKRIPERGELRDYDQAVAGHAGTLCDADGELFIKPCTQTEIEFYQSATRNYPDFADIMPLYMGSLTLSDTNADNLLNQKSISDQASSSAPVTTQDAAPWIPTNGKKIKTNTAVVLENAACDFVQPNILDVKLGTRLWADDAPESKKARLDKVTSETTHEALGFRIAGMRAFRGSSDEALLDKDGYLVYDKDYGRTKMTKDNILEGFRHFVFNETAGIDDELGRAVCAGFAQEVAQVQKVIEAHEARIYSSSLLFIFEGDGEMLRSAINRNNDMIRAAKIELGHRTNPRSDSGIAMGDDDAELIVAAVSKDGSDDSDSDSDSILPPRVLSLKLIDFAHAQWTPGQGPDENLLTGIKNLRQVFETLSK